MMIIGCDFHPSWQQVSWLDTETGETGEQKLVQAWGIVAGLWMLGELVHMSVTQAVRLPVKAVDFIDARTPDGTAGILGFVLLLIGFAFQMYGAYSGRPEVPPHSL